MTYQFEFKCGDPKHSTRKSEDGWTDKVLVIVESESDNVPNCYVCLACAKYLEASNANPK